MGCESYCTLRQFCAAPDVTMVLMFLEPREATWGRGVRWKAPQKVEGGSEQAFQTQHLPQDTSLCSCSLPSLDQILLHLLHFASDQCAKCPSVVLCSRGLSDLHVVLPYFNNNCCHLHITGQFTNIFI